MTAVEPSPSVIEILRAATVRLRAAGVDDPAGDVRALLGDVLACERSELLMHPGRRVTAAQAADFDARVSRRAAREPVARILGRRSFYGREFKVTPGVLDPRPDTETLVEQALELIRTGPPDLVHGPILDIGTGSGAILLTLLAELPTAHGLGIDVSADALACATENAQRLSIGHRAAFERRDLAAGLPLGFAIWVSNPPYIRSAEIEHLPPEVRDHDPRLALDGGADGLDPYRQILRSLVALGTAERPRWLLLEVGAGDSSAVIDIFADATPALPGLSARVAYDLDGRDRCVVVGLDGPLV